MKITVAEWIAYLSEPWPEGQYIEEEEIVINGVTLDPDSSCDPEHLKTLDQAAFINIKSGDLRNNDNDDRISLVSNLRGWQKKQKFVVQVINVPRERQEEFRTLLKNAGFLT